MIQLELSGNSGLYLCITWHPCDKAHVSFVRQPSAAQGCGKVGRRRRKGDVSKSTRRRRCTGSNQKAPKKHQQQDQRFLGSK